MKQPVNLGEEEDDDEEEKTPTPTGEILHGYIVNTGPPHEEMHDGYCEECGQRKKILSGDNRGARNLCYCSKSRVFGVCRIEPKEKGYCEDDILFGQRILVNGGKRVSVGKLSEYSDRRKHKFLFSVSHKFTTSDSLTCPDTCRVCTSIRGFCSKSYTNCTNWITDNDFTTPDFNKTCYCAKTSTTKVRMRNGESVPNRYY